MTQVTLHQDCPRCGSKSCSEVTLSELSPDLQNVVISRNISKDLHRCSCGKVWAEDFSYGIFRGEVIDLN